MSNSGRKSPRRAANDLTVLLRTVLGEDRFPVDVEALALEVSRNHEDPITAVKGVDIDGFEGMLRARRKKPGWQILYNTQPRYRGRERFTLAHEFGHYLLHRRPLTAAHYRNGELSDEFDFECLPLQANGWKAAAKQREEEADTFASFLLMPIDDYRYRLTKEALEHLQPRPHCQVKNDKKQHNSTYDAHMAPAHGVQPLNSWAAVSISSPALL